MKKRMKATAAMTYGTRRLKAGDEFVTTPRDARILAAIGKAKYVTREMRAVDPVVAEPEPVSAPEPYPAPVEDIADVRAAYERVVGRKPFMGWDIDTLRQKMAEAGGD